MTVNNSHFINSKITCQGILHSGSLSTGDVHVIIKAASKKVIPAPIFIGINLSRNPETS
jgi:hypothetical protein